MLLFSKFLPPLESFKLLLIAVFLPLFLVACGGSSDSSPPSQGEKIISTPKMINLKADSTSQITLSWNAVDGASYYEIYKNTTNTTTSGLTAISSQTSTTFKSTGLTANTTYYYWGKVCKTEGSVGSAGSSTNTAGHSCTAFSTVASKTTLVVIPNVPTNLSLTADSASQITVSWTGNGAANFYEIYRNTSNTNTSLTAIATPSTATPYLNRNLIPNTTYYYWVKACNTNTSGKKCSDFSKVASTVTWSVHPEAPPRITNVSLSADSTSQITVSWTDNNEATSYEIYRNTINNFANLKSITTLTKTNIPYKDTGLTADTTYYYWVKACKESSTGAEVCSDFSEVSSANTTLDSPKNLQLSGVTTSQITVSWDSVTGTNYYEVFRNTIDSNSSLTTAINQPANTTYTDSGLSTNTTYYYWVKGCSTGDICSDFSEEASTKTLKGELNWITATDSAAFSARSDHQAVVFNDGNSTKMWVIGGLDNVDYQKNDVWSSTNGVTWTTATDSAAFSARYGHQSVVFDNKIWVIGGTDGRRKNDVWSSTNGVTWTTATDSAAFSGRYYHQSVVFNDGNSTKMWVIGGYIDDGQRKNDVFSSTDGVTWTTATDSAQFSARSGHQAVVFDKKIWVIGGIARSGSKNDVWNSTDGVTWTTATDSAAFSARRNHKSVVFDNKIWVISGRSGSDSNDVYLNDVWNSTNGVTWTKAKASVRFSRRDGHQAVVFDNKIWVIGGSAGHNALRNDVWHTVKE